MVEDAGQVRQAIDRDKEELAGTVQALAHKADVKSRVREKVADGADQLEAKASEVADRVRGLTPEKAQESAAAAVRTVQRRPFPFTVVAVLLVGILIGRRSRRQP